MRYLAFGLLIVVCGILRVRTTIRFWRWITRGGRWDETHGDWSRDLLVGGAVVIVSLTVILLVVAARG